MEDRDSACESCEYIEKLNKRVGCSVDCETYNECQVTRLKKPKPKVENTEAFIIWNDLKMEYSMSGATGVTQTEIKFVAKMNFISMKASLYRKLKIIEKTILSHYKDKKNVSNND